MAIIEGDETNNILDGTAEDDTINGLGGDDIINSSLGADTIDGGDGFDTVDYSASAVGFQITFRSFTNIISVGGDAEGDTFSSIERIVGTAFDDRIDYINNFTDGITFDAGDGNDVFSLGEFRGQLTSALTFLGGNGNDDFRVNRNLDDGDRTNFDQSIMDGGAGIDTLRINGSGSIDFSTTTLTGFEVLDFAGNVESYVVTFLAEQFRSFTNVDTSRRGTLEINILMEDETALDLSGLSTGGGNASPQDFFIEGDADAEQITGSSRGDVINGNGGDDTLDGGNGADIIDGGDGDDIIEGGFGDDTMDGGDGFDTLSYASFVGTDGITGLTIDTTFNTESMFDAGPLGTDSIRNFEALVGSAFNDTLTGNFDLIDGGAGDDVLQITRFIGLPDFIGGEGIDTFDYSDPTLIASTGEHFIDLTTGYDFANNDLGEIDGLLTDIENVIGSTVNDFIFGTDGVNVLEGNTGDDEISGRGGDDEILGGAGDDTLNGGAGADFIDGGGNFDTASYAGDTAGVIVNLDSVERLGVASNRALDGSGSTDTLRFIEFATGSDFADAIFGSANRNTLNGGEGDDDLFGRGGNDTLIGGLGDDLLNGAAGFDTADYSGASAGVEVDLFSGTANDGDGGTDTLVSIEFVTGSGFDDLFTGGDGNERFFGGEGDDEALGGLGNDLLNGEAGDDRLEGGDGNDRLNGGEGLDTLLGGVGNDTLDGGLGDDRMFGGNGDDRMFGRDGNDAMRGGIGVDVLNGQEGNDDLKGQGDRDFLRGQEGDDLLEGGEGDDRIDGGTGTDTAIFLGNQDDYLIIIRDNGVVSVEDTNLADGDEGTDILTTVEVLQFADGTLDLLAG